MKYTFEILGVLPLLQLFNHQQTLRQSSVSRGVEYIGCHHCTLDAFLAPIEGMSHKQEWDLDRLVQTVIEFWMTHPENIQLWKHRLDAASGDTVLVARVGHLQALRQEFEWMLGLRS